MNEICDGGKPMTRFLRAEPVEHHWGSQQTALAIGSGIRRETT